MMDRVIIKRMVVGDYRVNAWLVGCPRTREAVLIDPGDDAEKLLELIERERLSIRYILNTHGHADHTGANRKMKKRLAAPICMHEADIAFFAGGGAWGESDAESGAPSAGPPDLKLNDGDELTCGDLSIKVIHTPGHTPGSVCYLVAGNLFTGDALFVGDVGRTDLEGGSLKILLESLEKKVITLPKETIVRPAHDYGETPTSTIGREMEKNPYITDFILA